MCRSIVGISSVAELTAAICLYRPGLFNFIPDYIPRKKGEIHIYYEHPLMESVLAETYGLMIYQEQIMTLIHGLSGMSLGEADLMRRALGKKKESLLLKYKEKFFLGCERRGIDGKTIETLFEKIAEYAPYGFNKAHAVSIALIAYRSAYLKANYKREFDSAL